MNKGQEEREQFDRDRIRETREKMYSFMTYIQENPEQRFWQALKNWSGHDFILRAKLNTIQLPEGQGAMILSGPLWKDIKDTYNE